MKIPLCKTIFDQRELSSVKKLFRSGWFIHGAFNNEFEQMAADHLGVKHAVGLNSCTSALQLAVQANSIKGEVIVPSFTFTASANAIVTAGARPVFADIEYSSCNIDPDAISSLIGPRTEAVMIVHFAGHPCRMDEIMKIAARKHLLVIEDSAETMGGMYGSKKTGSFGTGCFSFYPTKNMSTIEGGILTTDDDKTASKVRELSGHGMPVSFEDREKSAAPWRRSAVSAGYNYRMSSISAAIGVEQLKKLDRMNDKRRKHASWLNRHLDKEFFDLPVEEKGCLHVYQMYTVKVKRNIDRDMFVRSLRKSGIGASVHFDPPVHQQTYYRNKPFRKGALDITERVSRNIVTLPMYPALNKKELKYMAENANRIAGDLCSKKR